LFNLWANKSQLSVQKPSASVNNPTAAVTLLSLNMKPMSGQSLATSTGSWVEVCPMSGPCTASAPGCGPQICPQRGPCSATNCFQGF